MPGTCSRGLLWLAVVFLGMLAGSFCGGFVCRWSLAAVVLMSLVMWLNEDGNWEAICDRMGWGVAGDDAGLGLGVEE